MADGLDLETIIAELDAEYSGKLPERALREAQRRGAEIIPHLIGLITKATTQGSGGEGPARNGHLYALYLLAEFRAKEALAAVVQAVSLPGEGPFDLFGDTITEDLNRVLAVLAADKPEIVDSLIADRSINEYVRWQAAQTYFHWVRDGSWSREQAVQRLRSHLVDAIACDDYDAATGLVAELVTFSPREAFDEIQEAFRRDLVDRAMVGPKTVERSIEEGEAWFQRSVRHRRPAGIEDTVAELRRWACFQDPDSRPSDSRVPAAAMFVEDDADIDPALVGPDRYDPLVPKVARRVGRNEPCPCGSGKKYKKCCGRSTTS